MLSKVHDYKLHLRLENLICLLIVAGALLVLSCQGTRSTATEYELYIDRAVEVWQFQGSYLVAKGDSILARGGRGFANLSEQRSNGPKTKFLIGSTTKPFTAIAILQLVEKGLVDLNLPFRTYINDYTAERADKVTVHYLLSHRSGIPDVVSNPEFSSKMRESITPHEIVEFFQDRPLDFTPGSRYSYSSSNYVLLGLIVEAVTGPSWNQYIQEHICRKIGMENTGVYYDYAERSDFASGYAPGPSGSLVEVPPIHPSCGYAAGALASTVDDLYQLHKALYDTTLLDCLSIDMMLTQHSPTYGYGWLIDDFGGHRLTAHGGGAPGYVSIMQRWLDDSICAIVLCNNVRVPAYTIANALAAIALGERYDMPIVKTPLSIQHERLAECVGTYELGSGEYRVVSQGNGGLLVQRSSGPARPVFPEAEDKFYFGRDHLTTISFIRDDLNNVVAHTLTQAFDQDTAWRVEVADHMND
ncbi:MAG: hypothetical protein DRP45_01580 [Candidatus Zixiibacteriota bacterium]|nr:MAG: hypothetical protein DRP45_01580 [candidate division Zixibacteria bacterium]